MRAMVATSGHLEMTEIPLPVPGQNEVRVKVIAAAVNPAEEKVLHGGMVGRFLHAYSTPLVLGWDFSGIVDALGNGVSDLPINTAVWGHLAFTPSQRQGTFSEYVVIPRDELAAKPDDVSFDVAAAAATVTMTALQSLRDLGRLKEGRKALIIGAGGGIGAVAIGIAKRLGGHVTAICSAADFERVKALGADDLIDYRSDDPLGNEATYDVVFDTPAVHTFSECANILRPGGSYVTTLPNAALVTGKMSTLFSSKSCHFIQVASRQDDLELVGEWLSDGLEVPIDSTFAVADLAAALARQSSRERKGRVVVSVDGGWPT
jgi:NADPH:quinone reductase-like Zn-dependent oxidoreductase